MLLLINPRAEWERGRSPRLMLLVAFAGCVAFDTFIVVELVKWVF